MRPGLWQSDCSGRDMGYGVGIECDVGIGRLFGSDTSSPLPYVIQRIMIHVYWWELQVAFVRL